MGKSSSAKQNVVDYKMSIHFGISTTLDKIRRILINEKVAWVGEVTTASPITINAPDLFGGEQKEGGPVGVAHFLPGKADQVMPEELAAKMGLTSATCPAYRGKASVFFRGLVAAEGFLWSKNTPIVAQNIWFEGERTPIGLDPTLAWIDSTIVNPAHIIYESLTNTSWGAGMAPASIDIDAFTAAAQTLHDEALGLSIFWNRQSTFESFITEVLNHINGTYFLDPSSGKLSLKLIRDDYDTGTLRVIDASIAELRNLQQRLPGETVNEVVVTWTNPETEQGETYTLQDPAGIATQGEVISSSRNYYGVRSSDLAAKLAARDLRSAGAPLYTFTLNCDRSAWNLKPGEVFLANFAAFKGVEIVTRVLNVEYGKTGDGKVKVSCIQDIFSLDHLPVAAAPPSEWIDPAQLPTQLDAIQGLSIPYFFASSTELQTAVIDLAYPETLAVLLGYEPDPDTFNYDLLSRVLLPNGSLAYQESGTKTLAERLVLGSDLPRTDTTVALTHDLAQRSRPPHRWLYVHRHIGCRV